MPAEQVKLLKELDTLSNQAMEHYADTDLTLYDTLNSSFKKKQTEYQKLYPIS